MFNSCINTFLIITTDNLKYKLILLCILKHELNMHKIRPEKSDQAIGPELQVTNANANASVNASKDLC